MKHESSRPLTVTVKQADINKMLDSYDSGMTDVNTSNAIALALRRSIKPEHHVHVYRNSVNKHCCCRIDEHEFILPEKLFDWLEKAEIGLRMETITFEINVAAEWLRNPSPLAKKPKAARHPSIAA